MLKITINLLIFTSLFLSSSFTIASVKLNPISSQEDSPHRQGAYDLISAVNQLRIDHGLHPLSAHPILMQVAQAQADYNASIGYSSHIGPNGSRPFQRALAAGFPVAGDLSMGGLYSENIMGGSGISPNEVVMMWMGDAPHQNTMLSEMRSDMGAGVTVVGDFIYYVLDTALASQYSVAYTPSSNDSSLDEAAFIAPVIANTPRHDGSIFHTVQTGETLWTIAAAYKLKVEQITLLNGLNPQDFIHPGDQLVIRQISSPTQTQTPQHSSTPPQSATGTSTAAPKTTTEIQEPPETLALPILMLSISVGLAILAVVIWLKYR